MAIGGLYLKCEASDLIQDFVKFVESKVHWTSTMKAVNVACEKVCIINIEEITLQFEMSANLMLGQVNDKASLKASGFII